VLKGAASPGLITLLAGAILLCSAVGEADQLRFEGASQWREWQFSRSSVQLNASGGVEPVRFRKDIDAVVNAVDFGGGILNVGSNPFAAPRIMDGDPATGWSPDPDADRSDWFVEIDLGRGVSARRIELHFDEDSPPFELFDLLLSTGESALDRVGNPIEGSVVFRLKERFSENRRHHIIYEPEILFNTPIQVLRIDVLSFPAGARLVEVVVETPGDNLAVNLLERGGSLQVVHDVTGSADVVSVANGRLLVDGSIPRGWRVGSEPRRGYDTWSEITLDLGASYLVDFVRIVGSVGAGRGFSFKFYELLTSDGSLAPNGTLIWDKHFSGLAGDINRLTGLADHHFPAVPTRFVRIAWLIWDAACADFYSSQGQNTKWICFASGSSQEIQVFGEGFPRSVGLTSPLLDLGEQKNLNTIEWGSQTPPGTRVELRSRTGNDVVEQYIYQDKNGKEVTQRQWGRLIPSFRGPIDTVRIADGNWSPWSAIYPESGARFLSPSPRRYLELNARLVSDDPQIAPQLEWLALNFTEPIASETFGEIVPLLAEPGVETEFSYFLRPGLAPAGFDRVVLEATAVLTFTAALVEGTPQEVSVESDSSGFRVTFPRRILSGELVELRFQSTLFVQSRIDAFLQDSRLGDDIRQQVDPGDATDLVESSTNVVRLPLNAKLLGNVDVSARVITPNGDGNNDELRLSVKVTNVLESRPLRLRVFDLGGHLVWEEERLLSAGQHTFVWAGRRAGGSVVPPGLYLLELRVSGDARQETVRRIVGVVY
jgi:hypothetical protein